MGSEYSYESESLQNGFFTSELLEALKGAASDGGDVVSVRELQSHVMETVPKLTDGQQHPTVDRDNPKSQTVLPVVK